MNHIYTTPPKTGFLISKINDLPKSGHATLREFSSHIQTCQIMTCNMLAKNEKYLVAEFGENVIICYHFVII